MSMKLSMLGHDYRYGFAPVSDGYARANGSGYVRGINRGLSGYMDGSSVVHSAKDAASAYLLLYPGKIPTSASDYPFSKFMEDYNSVHRGPSDPVVSSSAALSEIKSLSRAEKLENFSQNIQTIIGGVASGVKTIAGAIEEIKGSGASEGEKKQAISYLQWKQYLPWMIGGGAVLIGLFLVMGTRRRLRRLA